MALCNCLLTCPVASSAAGFFFEASGNKRFREFLGGMNRRHRFRGHLKSATLNHAGRTLSIQARFKIAENGSSFARKLSATKILAGEVRLIAKPAVPTRSGFRILPRAVDQLSGSGLGMIRTSLAGDALIVEIAKAGLSGASWFQSMSKRNEVCVLVSAVK